MVMQDSCFHTCSVVLLSKSARLESSIPRSLCVSQKLEQHLGTLVGSLTEEQVMKAEEEE